MINEPSPFNGEYNDHYDDKSDQYQFIHKISCYLFLGLFWLLPVTRFIQNPDASRLMMIGFFLIYTAFMGFKGKFVWLYGFLGNDIKRLITLNSIYLFISLIFVTKGLTIV